MYVALFSLIQLDVFKDPNGGMFAQDLTSGVFF